MKVETMNYQLIQNALLKEEEKKTETELFRSRGFLLLNERYNQRLPSLWSTEETQSVIYNLHELT